MLPAWQRALLLLSAAPAFAAKPAPEPVNTPDSLVAAARAAASRGETELALRLAQSAIVADPARPASYDALGDVYAASNQPEFARNYYNEALSIDPLDAAAIRAIAALDRNGEKRAANVSGTKTGTP